MIFSIAGNLFLYFSLFFCIITNLVSLDFRKRIFFLHSVMLVISISILISSFINDQFIIKNVFLNSSTELPLIFKISACWASHEGSILLFVSLLSIYGVGYLYFLEGKIEFESFAIRYFSLIISVFLIFVIFSSNPFSVFSFNPKEGTGLNPMLQDIAVAIHPPTLYLGNSCYIAMFVNGLMLLKFPHKARFFVKIGRFFSNLGMMFLSFGIALGSWWAYRELGWGGYWFFDPVENISLIPWLFGIILHHYLVINKQLPIDLKKITILSFLILLSVIYGTCLVRSGLISSIHAFAFDPKRGLFLLAIAIMVTLIALINFCLYSKNFTKSDNLNPRSFNFKIINISSYFWYASAFILIISLIYPIYYNWYFDSNASIDPNYYYKIFIPIFIPLILLCAYSFSSTSMISYIFAILIIIIINYYKIAGAVVNLIYFLSILLLFNSASSLLYHIKKGTLIPSFFAKFLAHYGFALLALSICLNVEFTKEFNFTGKIGETVSREGMSVKFASTSLDKIDNYYRQIVKFEIKDGDKTYHLSPENRLYKKENTTSQEVDIISMVSQDYYAVLSKIDNKIISATIYKQFFISFIWLALILIGSGFFIRIRKI